MRNELWEFDWKRLKKGILMGYISRSCDLPKKEILVAYISSFKIVLDRISQKGDLIAYINRLCG